MEGCGSMLCQRGARQARRPEPQLHGGLAAAPARLLHALRPCSPTRSARPPACMPPGLMNGAIIPALGGPTGPALNPFRDLGPRLAFHLLPIPGK